MVLTDLLGGGKDGSHRPGLSPGSPGTRYLRPPRTTCRLFSILNNRRHEVPLLFLSPFFLAFNTSVFIVARFEEVVAQNVQNEIKLKKKTQL